MWLPDGIQFVHECVCILLLCGVRYSALLIKKKIMVAKTYYVIMATGSPYLLSRVTWL